jgi:tetraacyldisaccharide 4'-kinase
MNPLSAIFGAGVAMRNALYDRGVLKINKLTRPVVSVGNISVGGSGKTPFVIALGELLKERGITFDVLSRGYARSSSDVALVDPKGSPDQFGDEPLLIARTLGVPVIVGADRYQAGLFAEQKLDVQLHLLDDGFQHRRLHRDFDIVMVPASDLQDTLLPGGRLRESVQSLRRADAVVVDAEENAVVPGAAKVWRISRKVSVGDAAECPLAFCGIARPQPFFARLRELGLQLVDTVAFPDHHRYSDADIQRLLRLKTSAGADGVVTTEKDYINLGFLRDRLQPLAIAKLRLIFEDPDHALGTMLNTLEQRCGCRFPAPA